MKCRETIQYKKNSNNTRLNETQQSSSMCNPDLKRAAWVATGYHLQQKQAVNFSFLVQYTSLMKRNASFSKAKDEKTIQAASLMLSGNPTVKPDSTEISWNSAEHRQGFSSSGDLI